MIAKLLVLLAALAGIWVLFKLLGKVGEQNKEIQMRRQKEEYIRARQQAERDVDIIDLEQDPETGDFREK